MSEKNDNIKAIFLLIYICISLIATIIAYLDFSARHDWLTTLFFGWIISLIKGFLWPIFILFIL